MEEIILQIWLQTTLLRLWQVIGTRLLSFLSSFHHFSLSSSESELFCHAILSKNTMATAQVLCVPISSVQSDLV